MQLLIARGANPYMFSKLGKNQKEKILVVSSRWNHKEITKYLLETYEWKRSDI